MFAIIVKDMNLAVHKIFFIGISTLQETSYILFPAIPVIKKIFHQVKELIFLRYKLHIQKPVF